MNDGTDVFLHIYRCTYMHMRAYVNAHIYYVILYNIHSFIPAISIAPLQGLYYTQRRFRLQLGYCIGVSRRSTQAAAGKGLAQGPYVAARAGVEPTTLRLKVIVSTKAPPRPT